MTSDRQWFRKLRRIGWLSLAAVVIFLAAFLGTVQLLLPVAGQYREDIEQWASRSFDQPVRIGALGAAWRGFGPRLRLEDVRLLDHDGRDELVRFDTAFIGIDLLGSFRFGELRPGAITVVGVRLTLVRNADGAVSVSGLKRAADPPEGDAGRHDAMRRWLLRQRQLAVEAGEIEWIDRRKKDHAPWRFTNVHVRLRNRDDHHRLEGFATLPGDLGRRLQFGFDATGNFARADDWHGELYLQGTALRLPGWLDDTPWLGARLAGGGADFRLWSTWTGGRPVSVDGDVSGYDLKLAPGPGASGAPTAVDAVSGRFSWRRHDDGWALGVERFLLKRRDEIWPPSDFHVAYRRDDQGPIVEGAIEFLRIEDIAAIALTSGDLKPELRDALTHLQPAGVVRDLQLRYQKNRDRRDSFAVRAGINALVTRPWRNAPGVAGVAGSVVSSETSGHAELDTRRGRLDFGGLFREALPIDAAHGRVHWRRSADAWHVHSDLLSIANEDIVAHGTGGLILPDGGAPFLDLVIGYERGNGARTSRYLPVAVMPDKAVDWLDRAIVSGDVTSGWMLFHGRPADFPFDDGSGRFEVRFNVRDAILDYAPGWPRLEEIEAEVVFENRGLTVFGRDGKSFASTLDDARVVIPDFAAADRAVTVTGRAHGPTADALRYLHDSPLREKFGKYFEDATADGASRLDLELHVPLYADGRPRVKAVVGFDDSTLRLAGDRVAITAINGGLTFTERGVAGEGIRARVLDLPAVISASTDAAADPPVTRFAARGSATAREFAGLVDLPLVFNRVSGKADWQADLALRANDTGPANVALDIRSPLQGMAVRFPAPFGKAADTPRELRVAMALPQGPQHPVRVSYGDVLRVVYVQRDGDGLKPDRLALRFGAAPPEVPASPGIHLSGALERFAASEWSDLFDAAPIDGAALQVMSVDVGVREATVFGRRFEDVRLTATREPKVWRAGVFSRQLTGKVQYPHDLATPLVMELDYMKLERRGDAAAGEPLDPRKLPPLRVRANQFVYGGGDWGSLNLTTSRRPDGMHIDDLKLDSATTQVNARGDWVVVKGAHSSSLDLKMNTGNLGQVLKNLDYVGGIDGGRGTVELIALWAGPMSAFALEHLDGTMRMNIKDGRILDIEPGAGRLFGLLSVQALPRRLSLDFSDLFRKGFGFDTMGGQFSIDGGNAYTEDFYVEGPAARIETKGRVGLANRDYDQLVSVTPHVTSGLPVAGVIAGGPAVGAAVYLAERLLKPGIEEIVTIQYAVKGDWNNPVVERMARPAPAGTR